MAPDLTLFDWATRRASSLWNISHQQSSKVLLWDSFGNIGWLNKKRK